MSAITETLRLAWEGLRHGWIDLLGTACLVGSFLVILALAFKP